VSVPCSSRLNATDVKASGAAPNARNSTMRYVGAGSLKARAAVSEPEAT
jgi:hypothetical protein